MADYAPAVVAESKIKREGAEIMCIELKRNPDIAASLSREKGKRLTIGFALETDNGADNARRKLEAKNLDWVVLNRLGDPGAGFGVDTNSVTLFSCGGEELSFPVKSKQEVARDIVATVFSLR